MNTQEMKVLTLSGTPTMRGHTIGESLCDEIRLVVEKHEHAIGEGTGYCIEDYLREFSSHCNHIAAIEKWAPDHLEEVYATADAVNIDRNRFLLFQLIDEHWAFDAYHYAKRARIHNKCTSFGVVGEDGQPTFAGQNMDIPSYVEGHQILLHIQYPDSDLESLIYTFAGSISLCGMNNSPLGINLNTLMQLGYKNDGLPIVFLVRLLLETASYEQAVRLLNSAPISTGINVTVSEPGRVGAFECSPNKIVEYRPREDGRRVCHSNHPLVNGDTGHFEQLKQITPESKWIAGYASTCSRLASMSARTVNRQGPIKLDDLKAALRASDDPINPVCRGTSTDINSSVIAYTAGSMVYELSDNPQMNLASGPPTEAEFVTFGFAKKYLQQ